jgi:outer membrane protein TolC
MLLLATLSVSAGAETLSLTRAEAERDAIHNSERLKSFAAATDAVREQTAAQYALLYPRLSFDLVYKYLSKYPSIQANGISYEFGAHNNYTYGPTLSYTVWDTFATRDLYRADLRLADSREQDWRGEELRLLLDTRNDYIRVQENLEELRAVSDSLSLARSQNQYIVTRLKSGAATRLDRVESERAILSYQIQFAQKQSELSSSIKDLLARTQDRTVTDLSNPGAAGIPGSSLTVDFDSIQKSLDEMKGMVFSPPDETHPYIQSPELQAQSAELQARSIWAGLYPSLNLKAGVTLDYPFPPDIKQVNQNFVALTATVPLFEMGRTRHLSWEKLREADSARFQKEQTRIDLARDYDKAREVLTNLLSQQLIAAQDVQKSAEAAHLYFEQYKGGKVNLIDVQSADNRALLSRVNKARIDAQILNQVAQLKALSAKEIP